MTQAQQLQNLTHLQNFIDTLKLRNPKSGHIKFDADIHVETDHINEDISEPVMVNFDQPYFGTLTILTGLPPTLYPNQFIVKYQTFDFIDKKYLVIKGFHSVHAITMGHYTVKIVPC